MLLKLSTCGLLYTRKIYCATEGYNLLCLCLNLPICSKWCQIIFKSLFPTEPISLPEQRGGISFFRSSTLTGGSLRAGAEPLWMLLRTSRDPEASLGTLCQDLTTLTSGKNFTGKNFFSTFHLNLPFFILKPN